MSKHDRKNSKSKNSSSNNSSESSDSEGDVDEKIRDKLKKMKKKLRKEERKTEKRLKKRLKKEKKKLKKEKKHKEKLLTPKQCDELPPVIPEPPEKTSNIPIGLMEKSKAMAPMTKEEWEKRQSVVRKVLDEESGRYRLIKGDGEVLEEIVTQKRHKEINKHATRTDGAFFATVLGKEICK